jgi:hypothetical protein
VSPHGRERILDAVVQLFKDQPLQLVGRLALPGLNAGVGKQIRSIDLGLRKEKPPAEILRRQKVLMRFCAAPGALVCMEIVFSHPQSYQSESVGARSSAGSDAIRRCCRHST